IRTAISLLRGEALCPVELRGHLAPTGFEPALSGLKDRHVEPLHHGALCAMLPYSLVKEPFARARRFSVHARPACDSAGRATNKKPAPDRRLVRVSGFRVKVL